MPDDRIKISALPSALLMDNTDVFAVVQGMTGDNKATKKAAVTLIAAHLLETMQHNNLDTSDKTIIGAINEVAETLEGLYPVADASGPVANFETELSRPLEALKVGIVATQESGTPTPSAPLPISGVSSVKIARTNGDNSALITALRGLLLGTHNFVKFEDLSLSYSNNSGQWNCYLFYALITNKKRAKAVFCSDYPVVSGTPQDMSDKQCTAPTWNDYFYVRDDTYTTIPAFTSAKGNAILIYECDTPITPTITLEQFNTICQAFGISGETVTIALGDTYYGGYVTQDKSGHRQLVVDKGYEDLSDLSWVYNSSQNAFVSTSLISRIGSGSNVLCSRYKTIIDLRGSALSTQDYAIGINKAPNTTTGNFQIGSVVVKDSTYTDAATFTNAVSGSKMIYELATPLVIDLPDGVPIETLIGVNNIFADSGDILECKYKDTIQHYIDTQIAATQALIL